MPSIGLTCVHVSLNARCGERVTNQRFREERRKTCTGMCGKSPLVTTASESLAHFCAFGVFDIVLLFCGFVSFLSLAVVSPSQVVSCLVIAPSVIPSRVLGLFRNVALVPFIFPFRTRTHICRPTVCVTPCCVSCCTVGQPHADRSLLEITLSMYACTTPDLFVCLQSPPYLYTDAVNMNPNTGAT